MRAAVGCFVGRTNASKKFIFCEILAQPELQQTRLENLCQNSIIRSKIIGASNVDRKFRRNDD